MYDCPEINSISNFIQNINGNDRKKCECYAARYVLDGLQGRDGGGLALNNKSGQTTNNTECDDDDEPFVPDNVLRAFKKKVQWNNDYKWGRTQVDDMVRDDETGPSTLSVNCLQVYLDCDICASMMDVYQYDGIIALDVRIKAGFIFKNIATSVHAVCKEEGYDKKKTDLMINHYTNPLCQMNSVKFINFSLLSNNPSR